MTNHLTELAERDQKRRDAITAWWERKTIRDFLARMKARSQAGGQQ